MAHRVVRTAYSMEAAISAQKAVDKMADQEHLYYKDNYRFILAEEDPTTPDREAYEVLLDPNEDKPSYLYRMKLSKKVLLSLNDRAPQLKISDDRLSVEGEKGYSMVRATHCVNKGTWYYEVTIDSMPDLTATRIGWSQQYGCLQANCGYEKFSYAWRSMHGTRFHDTKGYHYADEGYGQGDTIGLLISLKEPVDPEKLVPLNPKDLPMVKFKDEVYYAYKLHSPKEVVKYLTHVEGNKMVCFKNGVDQGVAYSDMYEGWYYPAISIYKNASVTVNFGPDFKFPPKNHEFKPMSETACTTMVEHAMSDLLFHVDALDTLTIN